MFYVIALNKGDNDPAVNNYLVSHHKNIYYWMTTGTS